MSSTVERVILAGFSGHGIFFMGNTLAEAGMRAGKNVSLVPSYSSKPKGGLINSALLISEKEIASPMITVPDTVIAMNRTSVNKFNQKIKGGGMLMYNSSLIDRQEFRDDIRLVEIPSTEIAAELGEPKTANMVMAGAYAKFSKLVTVEEIENSIRFLLKDENKDVIELNIESVKKGYDYVEEKKYMFGRYVHSVFRV